MIREISERVFSDNRLLLLIALANLAGFFVGIYYYWNQLMDSSPLLWIVILDSPISVLLFSVVCFLMIFRKRVPELLKLIASVYVIKYGLWTMITIYLYWSNYVIFEDQVIGIFNFFLHFGMILEGIVLIPRIKLNVSRSFVVLALFLLNDYMDYFHGTVTRIPPTHLEFLMFESFLATLVIISLSFIYQNKLS
jgi:uncharacterized membrane protein YpjA